ncbi:hypothetical protein NF556_10225 [Ornithinimicrobium faecis]|uniref:Uncharacterized protein n=1 Tax=Ornithinimicrobium faecis TaxID=2934158 RepID=A0ABY4YZG5_9MICO|nr:hypothetical protein [Ornithinimicrobium sp. HY1793]USQ81992.1 hypothetical protein NF556_10225 [Ornithinimicrobium sp. HY1793]
MPQTSRPWPLRQNLVLARGALRSWSPRQVLVAAVAAVLVAVVIGVATVLMPNPIFGRDIPPVWWNYPVWLVTSALSGMLLATYLRQSALHVEAPDAAEHLEAGDVRSSRLGAAGGVLAWCAVGWPVPPRALAVVP